MDRRTLLSSVAVLSAASLVACSSDSDRAPVATTEPPTTPTPSATPTSVDPTVAETIASGLNVPWGLAFLASGAALVSQRDDASIVRVDTDGSVTSLGRVSGVAPTGEAGLLGIALAPDDESTVYAYLTTTSDNRVVRLSLDGDRLGDPDPILTGIPIGARHHGGRLLFDPDGHLFVATGDAGDGARAQNPNDLGGKILRITTDGDAVDGNPFNNRTWSYGHRNVEGLAFDADGRLWASEFGEKRADELNLIEKGGNYGWPLVEGEGGGDDYVQPKTTWGTDEASPAGLAIARSTAFLGALQGQGVWMVPLDGESTGEATLLFGGDFGRVRNVVVAPDESLWITTSNTDGRRDPGPDDDRIVRFTL